MVSMDLVQACRNCVDAFATAPSPAGGSVDNDVTALVVAVDLLRYPIPDVVRWLGGAVLMLARDLEEADLAGLTSRRLPEPGVVYRTVVALRDGPPSLEAAVERDPVGWVLRLAATAAALVDRA